MAESYSTSLKITLIGDGDLAGTWGDTTNTNWNLVEQAVTGVDYLTTMGDANYTLTNLNGISDEARNQVIVVPSSVTLSATRYVYAPFVNKTYVISNQSTGGQSIYIQGIVSGTPTGSPLLIPNGVTTVVYCDGANGFYAGSTGSAGNFLVNGTLTAAGETETGNMTIGGNLAVTGTTTHTGAVALNGGGTSTTPANGDNSTKIATTAFVTQNSVLTGALIMWPTASAPSGYLLCNGSAVSRTTYTALFAVVGTTFGAGDGSTTFNLPNYADRMPIGAGTIAASIGASGGSATTTLSTSNLPSHSHSATSTVTDPGHVHTPYVAGTTFVANGGSTGGTGPNSNASLAYTTASAVTGISVATSIGNTGSGTAATTISPYLGINFIIKT
jgi:microcystin-dependent protein